MPNPVEYIINIAGNAERKLSSIEKGFDKVNSSAESAGKKLGGFDKLKNLGASLMDTFPAIGALANPVGLAAGAVVAAGAAIGYATNKAMDFEEGMAKANGTMQKTPAEVAKIRNQLLGLAKDAGIDGAVGKVPEAFNLIVSGVGDADQSLDIMRYALKGAEAGFSDLNDTSNAGVNIMNSVGAANTTAAEVYDVLFATLNKGKGEFNDIANYLPKIIPASNNLGISFKETAGAFAFLTANGLGAEQSTTALQNAFKALGTGKIRKELKDFGVDVFDSQGKMRSLTYIAEDMAVGLKGLTDEKRTKILESLGFDQEASLAFAKFSQNAGLLEDTISATVNSAGAMQKTLDASSNPMATQRKLWNQVDVVATKLGYLILPVWNKVLGFTLSVVNGVVNGFEKAYNNSQLFRDVLSVIWEGMTFGYTLISNYFGIVSSLFTGVGKAINWIYTFLGGEGNLFEKIFGGIEFYYGKIRNFFMRIIEVASLANQAFRAGLEGDFDKASKLVSQAGQVLAKGVPTTDSKVATTSTAPKNTDANNVFGPDKKALGYLNKIDGKEKEQAGRVTAGGSRPVNINIRMEALNKGGITINSATVEGSATQLEKQLMDMLLRVVNGANQMAVG